MLVKMLDSICKFVNKRLKLRKRYFSVSPDNLYRMTDYINKAVFDMFVDKRTREQHFDDLLELRKLYLQIVESQEL